MDILKKNLNKNFYFFFKNINIIIIILLFIIKIIIYFILINKKFIIKILEYIIFFLKNTINVQFRNIFFFYNSLILMILLLSNLLDLLPLNLIKNILNFKKLEIVPTSNINITFSYSILSIIIITYLSIKEIGIINFLLNFFLKPINNIFFFFFNFLIEFISYIMKPISLSLRLFGNLFSSEIIFKLISKMSLISNIFLNSVWGTFHYVILPLQAFIFITLITIYLSQNLKH